MKTKKLLTVILSIILASCAPVSISTPTETLVPTATRTVTSVPPTPTATSEPSPSPTPTEAAPKEGDTRNVTENGHDYRYTYDEELGWVRVVAKFPLYDWPTFNAIPFNIVVLDGTPGERNIVTMTHKDFLMSDVPSSGRFDPPPITATFGYQVKKTTGIDGPEFLLALRGADGHEHPSVPIILSNGDDANVVLSHDTGFILTIMTPEKLKKLGEDRVSTGYVEGIVYYAEVYGVDNEGNMLCRLAFDVPLNKVPDEALRSALFIFPASLVEKKDQRGIGQSDFSVTLAHKSRWAQADGITLDLELERVPTQP